MSNDCRADDRSAESITPRPQYIRPWPLINPPCGVVDVVDIAESFLILVYIGWVIFINQHVHNRMRCSWWAYIQSARSLWYPSPQQERSPSLLTRSAIFQSPIFYADMNITSLAECWFQELVSIYLRRRRRERARNVLSSGRWWHCRFPVNAFAPSFYCCPIHSAEHKWAALKRVHQGRKPAANVVSRELHKEREI